MMWPLARATRQKGIEFDAMSISLSFSWWTRFWHTPVRAERLALMRILLALALLTDQLFQLLPNLADFYGPEGVAYYGLHDKSQLRQWHWTILFFNTDELAVLYPLFGLWVAATVLFLVGWETRWMNVMVWFLTMCFINRNPFILNGGDDTMQMGLFLLLLGRSGNALSVDAWLARRVGRPLPVWQPAWPVRLLQIQLCIIYLSTGVAKLVGKPFLEGTWWDGTAIHYVLNYVTMSRWPFVQLPLPLWLTAILTYTSVWWETLFSLLVLNRWTRYPALVFGVLFHLGIYFTIEVGWFSFYTLAFYGVWVPCSVWTRRDASSSA
jgi:Vitamin K-dependent gamma-carboxylase